MLTMRFIAFRLCAGAALVLTAGSAPLAGQRPPLSPDRWAAFGKLFDAYADSDKIVGAAAVFVREGRVVAHHEFGFADGAAKKPVTERTLFHYGSITKTLTAIAIMQLRDRGLL